MSQKKPFSNLRPRHDDDYGITELLRQVAERSSLNEEEKREVSQIVKNVERKVEEKTPMGKIKYKMKDSMDNTMENVKNSVDNTIDKMEKNIDNMNKSIQQSVANLSIDDVADDDVADDHDDNESLKSNNSTAESEKKWGKDLLHKFSMPKNPLQQQQQQSDRKAPPTPGASAARDYFKTFTIKKMQNPLKSPTNRTKATSETANKIKARRQEIAKAFERSSQSGRDMFQNLSRNFENSLKNLESSLAGPQQNQNQVEADYDLNSPEYKMDIKGIALLKEIFPDESTENLIKMHFEHIQASKDH
eukprot:CAMPEP_0116131114 /NCGR_PEP_ID=MMETSP0329-20121206/8834_1 /TAXON_ID=697910 /ORGANISM="Pseudo-nitzschia arenysensis, Strain B593" /LENGTH=303 /DNA_ID=CAMNT_0003625525 /DNA_START=197 /DNA_END=1108 /DNA_ORIENTATION=+